MAEVWIITGGAGEWSDHYTWCQSVWSAEALATAEVDRLTAAEGVNRETAEPDDYYEWKSYRLNGPFALDPEPSDAGGDS